MATAIVGKRPEIRQEVRVQEYTVYHFNCLGCGRAMDENYEPFNQEDFECNACYQERRKREFDEQYAGLINGTIISINRYADGEYDDIEGVAVKGSDGRMWTISSECLLQAYPVSESKEG